MNEETIFMNLWCTYLFLHFFLGPCKGTHTLAVSLAPHIQKLTVTQLDN